MGPLEAPGRRIARWTRSKISSSGCTRPCSSSVTSRKRMVNIYLEGKLPPDIQRGLAFDIAAGPVPGEMHLAAGQEPVAVGVCAHLRDDDTVVGTHRPHHFAIAKGVPLDRMAAEMFGKATGLEPRQGRPHAPVRPRAQVRVQRHRGREHAAGRGSGARREEAGPGLRGGRLLRRGRRQPGDLPRVAQPRRRSGSCRVVFVCEDNRWAISVPKSRSTAIASNADRAACLRHAGRIESRTTTPLAGVQRRPAKPSRGHAAATGRR